MSLKMLENELFHLKNVQSKKNEENIQLKDVNKTIKNELEIKQQKCFDLL